MHSSDSDHEMLRTLSLQSVSIGIVKTLGPSGIEALRQLTGVIRKLYERTDPDTIHGKLRIGLRSDATDTGLSHSIEDFAQMIAAGHCVEIVSRERLIPVDNTIYESCDVSYEYFQKTETIYVKSDPFKLPNPLKQFASIFAVPRFSELRVALENFRRDSIHHSSCPIFEACWFDDNRLILVNRPEHIMRRSLERYLKNVLQGAETRPESIVDESHPVDLKVTWRGTASVALIEIKWLGKSLSQTGAETTYSNKRAIDGARQLANYLDLNFPRGTNEQTIGFLVVIDARRWGINTGPPLTCRGPKKYESTDLVFDVDLPSLRQDFATPIRMFAMPK